MWRAPILKVASGSRRRMLVHLIRLAARTALGLRPYLEIFGIDCPTIDRSCIRDYIHVHDLGPAHVAALDLRGGGSSQRSTVATGMDTRFSMLLPRLSAYQADDCHAFGAETSRRSGCGRRGRNQNP